MIPAAYDCHGLLGSEQDVFLQLGYALKQNLQQLNRITSGISLQVFNNIETETLKKEL